jgi:predicted DNA-binding protein
MNKSVKLYFRVTEDFAKRLNTIVETMPGDQSDVLRYAVEKFISEHERPQDSRLMAVAEPQQA